MSTNQKTATINATLSVYSEKFGHEYELSGEEIMNEALDSNDKAKIREILFVGFRNGEIDLSDDAKEKFKEDSELKKYISGLLNNWLRKAKEFNNGQKYVAKNPGSRSGSGDEQVRELRKLLKTQTDAKMVANIEQAIADRLAEIKPETKVEINFDVIPEHLKAMLGVGEEVETEEEEEA